MLSLRLVGDLVIHSCARLGDDGEVTLEFVKEMLEYQKSQKNIHKKCVSLSRVGGRGTG